MEIGVHELVRMEFATSSPHLPVNLRKLKMPADRYCKKATLIDHRADATKLSTGSDSEKTVKHASAVDVDGG